ncbi:RagB/SusD family nutrient uptake outer membrane protein [Sphingobacterium pedocola]|uniref:RagB/SusD family nutrient uptake outer membrane protein n=1 Tax=Sphingobacterium pedocola TaxID=2082722 RepID=A0ABR9T2W2_9SPHI|nr:RagB/SusD family nutrient uptake outer membrane protein [Sphingobacterium pedocola]MBE8719685.1 RagB/SusD family nutrient uptake outer membrane protein [Sphingobacterium pedocola]
MKAKYLLLVAIGSSCVSFNACRNYVEVEQFNVRNLKYTTDYGYLLNNNTVFGQTYHTPVLSGDDLVYSNEAYQQQQTDFVGWAYTWSTQLVNDELEDLNWSRPYQQIYTANEVIAGVMESVDGTESQKKALLAEAKVQRAYNYFVLVNLYGAIYNPETATEAIGVPLLLTPTLFAPLDRSSVADVYGQIVKDLQEGLVDIPTTVANKRHPNKAAVYALLAIVNLHMRNFTAARSHAEEALQYNSELLDLQNYATSVAGYPLTFANPETYFSKLVGQQYNEQLNPVLLALFDATDLRGTVFTQTPFNSSQMPVGAKISRKHTIMQTGASGIEAGPSVPEMLLIKAEVDARSGNVELAMEAVNTLRKKRYKAEDYVALSANTAEQALLTVVNERRREFFVSGRRWLDMRRFNLDADLAKEYRRSFKNQEHVLAINSNRYIYPVANKYLQFNPEIGQSPR